MSDWLEALPCRIGQIFVGRGEGGKVELFHRDDVGRDDLSLYECAAAAVEIARSDDTGAYRPLKTAPNLRHGWKLLLSGIEEAHVALDFFYPGRAAVYRRWKETALPTTPLRNTLERQSGMYRVAARATDIQLDQVIPSVCRSDGGCLRTILWRRDSTGGSPSPLLPATKFDPRFDQTGAGEATLPLLCQESCNILVAEIRKAVRG